MSFCCFVSFSSSFITSSNLETTFCCGWACANALNISSVLRLYSASYFYLSAIFASSSCFFLSFSASLARLCSSSAFLRAFSIFFFWFSDNSSTGISGSSCFTALNFLRPFGLGPLKFSTFFSSSTGAACLWGDSYFFTSSTTLVTAIG